MNSHGLFCGYEEITSSLDWDQIVDCYNGNGPSMIHHLLIIIHRNKQMNKQMKLHPFVRPTTTLRISYYSRQS